MSDDIRPANWHHSWVSYAEYDDLALILHYGTDGMLHLCLVPADIIPSGNHIHVGARRIFAHTFHWLEIAQSKFNIESEVLRTGYYHQRGMSQP